jgi:hypothetical protein
MVRYPESAWSLIKEAFNQLGAHWVVYTLVAVVMALTFNQVIR